MFDVPQTNATHKQPIVSTAAVALVAVYLFCSIILHSDSGAVRSDF